MKFLVIHPNMDIYGGGERVCHHILKSLIAHGQEVELLAFNFDQLQYSSIMGENLPKDVEVNLLGSSYDVEASPPFSVYKRRQNILKLLKKYKKTAKYDYTFSTQTISALETSLMEEAEKNIAYVHFPEIHFDYDHSKRSKKIYLWLYKKLLEKDISKLDLVLCNSNYTKAMTEKYWAKFGIKPPVVTYPPVETPFWSNKPLNERTKRLLYVGRFVPSKRHEMMRKLAEVFPQFEFVSAGLLRDSEKEWFQEFSKNLPRNYEAKTNLSEKEIIKLFQDSLIYCHLMEGEHFGIAPMEALASGCVTLVHNSGGSREFIPEEFRWEKFDDLQKKIGKIIQSPEGPSEWEKANQILRQNISVLKPENFEEQLWINLRRIIDQPVGGKKSD